MKRKKCFSFLLKVNLLFLIMAGILLTVACQKAEPNTDNTQDDTNGAPEEKAEHTAITNDYVIVYDSTSTRARTVAGRLQAGIKSAHGMILKMRKDTTEGTETKEIHIGNTTRTHPSTSDSIGSGGWCVRAEGDCILINGATSEALYEAVDYFLSRLEVLGTDTVFAYSDNKSVYRENKLAAADVTLRAATFNIKNGSGVSHDMAKLAELLMPLELDVVGLQEVDVGTSRAGGIDTLKMLAEAAGFPYYEFSAAIDFGGGKYGTGIMSKYPIQSFETVMLTTPEEYEQRAYGHAVLEIGDVSIDFYNTHLSYEKTDIRRVQFEELNAAIGGKDGFIVTGDFNTDVNAERLMIDNEILVHKDKYASFPSKKTDIDDVIIHKGWDIVDSGMVEVGKLSDHNLIWAELHYVG